jgi:enoyl-CoA hydratase/carnithine racemase
VTPASDKLRGDGALLVERPRPEVLRLTINDPERRNPISSALFGRLRDEVGSAGTETAAVVITGAGDQVFTSGADLGELGRGDAEGLGGGFGEAMELAQEAIEACPAPVIARIQGHALGAGYQLALACDIRVAVNTARLGVPASRFGLLPGHVHHTRMIQQLGPQTTRLLMLTGRWFTGEEALRRRLADLVCPREELDGVVDRLLDDIIAGAPLTVRNSKRIINTLLSLDARGAPLDRATEAHLDLLSTEAHTSDDVREGLTAFFEHRPPDFKGR